MQKLKLSKWKEESRISRRGLGFMAIALSFLSANFPVREDRSGATTQKDVVQMGNQIWTTRNLDVANFRNGDPIPQAKSNEEWERAGREKQPAWCYYNNDAGLGEKYGRMYNWYALSDPRGVIPEGWHLPSLDEWVAFEKFVDSTQTGFLFQCSEGREKGDEGFCALPGGYRFKDGYFTGIEEFTYISGGTADEVIDSNATKQPVIWGRGLHTMQRSHMRCGLGKEFGLYVRCIKD
jgi:uncharacterized protein (TIGR02145 family)